MTAFLETSFFGFEEDTESSFEDLDFGEALSAVRRVLEAAGELLEELLVAADDFPRVPRAAADLLVPVALEETPRGADLLRGLALLAADLLLADFAATFFDAAFVEPARGDEAFGDAFDFELLGAALDAGRFALLRALDLPAFTTAAIKSSFFILEVTVAPNSLAIVRRDAFV